ncbi:hypothetical protein Bbelb_357930 [Branchiostoma belcheri]|nr:hypothetical protein Bbelb_357930 [Branchiostoma belcheri]
MAFIETEQDYFPRGVKEAFYVRAHHPSLNRDEGQHRLPDTFDAVLTSHFKEATWQASLGFIPQGHRQQVKVRHNERRQFPGIREHGGSISGFTRDSGWNHGVCRIPDEADCVSVPGELPAGRRCEKAGD